MLKININLLLWFKCLLKLKLRTKFPYNKFLQNEAIDFSIFGNERMIMSFLTKKVIGSNSINSSLSRKLIKYLSSNPLRFTRVLFLCLPIVNLKLELIQFSNIKTLVLTQTYLGDLLCPNFFKNGQNHSEPTFQVLEKDKSRKFEKISTTSKWRLRI